MKRLFFFTVMLFTVESVFSQSEWNYNDKTLDEVYEAQDAKFVKKWNEHGDIWILYLNSNKTFKEVSEGYNDDYGVSLTITCSGTWKRVNKMTLVKRYTNITVTPNQKDLAHLSKRKQDEFRKMINTQVEEYRKNNVGQSESLEIMRIDNDHLILKRKGTGLYVTDRKDKKGRVINKILNIGTRDAYYFYGSDALMKKIEAEKEEREAKAKVYTPTSDKLYDVVEEMPQFPGGPSALFEYLSKNVNYPEDAEQSGVQGRVVLSFIIDNDGSVTDIKVQKSLFPSLDAEAVRVVKTMPKWVPGKQDGFYVRVKYNVPVTFRLQ